MPFKPIKQTFLLASAVALTLVSSVGFFSTNASAEMKNSTMVKSTATTQDSGAALVQQLKLTDKQKQEITTIRRNRTNQIKKVLSSDQFKKFDNARKSDKSLSAALTAANLKPDQKKQVFAILKKSADSIKATLNPQQQQQLATYLKQRHQSGIE